MPSNSKSYVRKHYGKKYWGTKEAINKVKARVQARRIMEKEWKVSKGDSSKEVDHINWTKAWNWKSNLRVISRLKNRVLWQKKAMAARKKNWTTTYNKS